jgi:tetratricopeptide (TPR) repeat protein
MLMKCASCNFDSAPEGVRFCPICGAELAKSSIPSTRITVTQKVGTVKRGTVKGIQIGKVKGKVTIRSTVNQIEKKIVKGDYVDRKTITNNILVLGPQALDEIAKRIAEAQGVDKQTLQNLGAQNVPEHVSRQIAEVVAAQKESASKGVRITPSAAYRLGMLAAYRRDYDEALVYFRQAIESDPEYLDAYEAVAWLQQYRATDDVAWQNYDAAKQKLEEARRAAERTDPLDPNALAQRGYIAKTLAQVAAALGDSAGKEKYYSEAAKLFQHVVQLEPENASAHNGLGNVEYARGNLDGAIEAGKRAIKLIPNYTAAHHDLAITYEAKMKADPRHAKDWRRKALEAWQRAYELAPADPGFSPDYIVSMGQQISRLRQQCGEATRRR